MNRLMVNYDLFRENAEPFRNRNVFYGLSTCEKLPIYLYRTTTLVKLLGRASCAAVPVWDKKDFFTLRSSHFKSRKSVSKGNCAEQLDAAVLCTGLSGGGYASALPLAGFSPP